MELLYTRWDKRKGNGVLAELRAEGGMECHTRGERLGWA